MNLRRPRHELNAEELFLVVLLTALMALVGTVPGQSLLDEPLTQVDLDAAAPPPANVVVVDIALRSNGGISLARGGHTETIDSDEGQGCAADLHSRLVDALHAVLPADATSVGVRIQGAESSQYCQYHHAQLALYELAKDDELSLEVKLAADFITN